MDRVTISGSVKLSNCQPDNRSTYRLVVKKGAMIHWDSHEPTSIMFIKQIRFTKIPKTFFSCRSFPRKKAGSKFNQRSRPCFVEKMIEILRSCAKPLAPNKCPASQNIMRFKEHSGKSQMLIFDLWFHLFLFIENSHHERIFRQAWEMNRSWSL